MCENSDGSNNSRSQLLSDGFVLVKTKKGTRKTRKDHTYEIKDLLHLPDPEHDKEKILRQLKVALTEIQESDLFASIVSSIREGLKLLDDRQLKSIICLGLGHFSDRVVPRYQLAILLCIKRKFRIDSVIIYDPIFWPSEIDLLRNYLDDLQVLDVNSSGRFQTTDDCVTLFFFPHCSSQLTNNLLSSNWYPEKLKNCMIIANSFNDLIDNYTKDRLLKTANYLSKIFPYTVELAIINNFKYFDVLNHTALHVFPSDKINLLPVDFWESEQVDLTSEPELQSS